MRYHCVRIIGLLLILLSFGSCGPREEEDLSVPIDRSEIEEESAQPITIVIKKDDPPPAKPHHTPPQIDAPSSPNAPPRGPGGGSITGPGPGPGSGIGIPPMPPPNSPQVEDRAKEEDPKAPFCGDGK